MKAAILVLFLCSGGAALSQSTASASAKPYTALNNPAWIDSMKLLQGRYSPSLAPLTAEHTFNAPPRWDWGAAQGGAKIILPTKSTASIAKLEPIPTQWPNLTVEQIPTDWPNLKKVLINSQLTPPAK